MDFDSKFSVVSSIESSLRSTPNLNFSDDSIKRLFDIIQRETSCSKKSDGNIVVNVSIFLIKTPCPGIYANVPPIYSTAKNV